MAKYLVIVESPAKEKTISKILGNDFTVKSSFGHIRDLPKKKLSIDTENNFEPTYVNMPKSKKIISELKSKADSSQKVYLATDLDREGEAIAWHLKEALKLNDSKIERITFSEITPEAIKEAVANPRRLNMGLVDSQQARRILDRIVGYKLSPLLWKKVKRGLSAGRVQSVAVMIICNREEEIKAFIPVEYWGIEADLSKKQNNAVPFKASIFSKNDIKFEKLSIKNKEEADAILKELENASYIVKSVESKQRKRSPFAPYTTSTMQQDSSRRLGFTASRTMSIAQKLYESGHITYMRTDSLNIAASCRAETQKYISSAYGDNCLPKNPRFYTTKSKGAQEAHEAIRPTSAYKTPSSIKSHLIPDEYKLYDLIWKRFVASQMADAVYNTISADIKAGDYIFRANGSVLIFDGFLKVYNIDEDSQDMRLPPLSEGEQLNLLKLSPLQHWTEPPARYNEASLIKALEEHEIGRPSTYAPIIKTILDRLYVRLDGKKFIPTELGIVVNDVLKKHFENIINVEFTAGIEEKFDSIAENKIKWQSVISDFYSPFIKKLEAAEKNLTHQKIKVQSTDIKCPNCGKEMVIRQSRSGQFLGCSGFPECKTAMPLAKDGKSPLVDIETDLKCDKCGSPLIKKAGYRGRSYLLCKNPDCKTKYTLDKNGNKTIKPEPEKTDIKCEKCGSMMLKRQSKRGEFLTCSAFPKCRNLIWIKQDKPDLKIKKTKKPTGKSKKTTKSK
ncbi:MAG: type I DNA topoisomerase [Endomicrobium sp.]|jgi:DNA topoisomerase-1|nr:type I DNA topoisomerase [Endomicrobium sp.]